MSFLKRIFTLGKDETYEKAIDFYNRHLYQEAVELFEEILGRKTSASSLYHNLSRVYCGQAHRNLGIIMFATGNFSTALGEFQKTLQFTKEHTDVYHFIGICQNNLGDFQGAVKTFSIILEVEPSRVSTKLKLAIALHNLKMWDKAATIYENILDTNPRYADVHYRLGLATLGQGNFSQAVSCFEQAVGINPNYTEARKKLGVTRTYLGQFDIAIEHFKTILEKYPEYADILYFMGIAYSGQNELDSAIRAFEKACRANPSYKEAKIKLGILYCRKGDFAAGLHELKEASRLDPDDRSLTHAIEAIQDIIEKQTYTPEQQAAILSKLFGGEKPLNQTIREFNKHIQINPDFSDILPIIKHFSEEDLSLCEMLIPPVQEYIKQHPEYPDLHNTLGNLYMKLDQTENAETCLKEAVRLNPQYVQARISLLKTLQKQSKMEEALKHGEMLIGMDLPYPDVYCTVGEVCFSLQKDGAAMQYAQKSLDLNTEYAQAYFLKAQIFKKQGNTERAIEELKNCLHASPSKKLFAMAQEEMSELKVVEP